VNAAHSGRPMVVVVEVVLQIIANVCHKKYWLKNASLAPNSIHRQNACHDTIFIDWLISAKLV